MRDAVVRNATDEFLIRNSDFSMSVPDSNSNVGGSGDEDDISTPALFRRSKSSSIEFLIPYVGIDIGGTLAKLCFALKKNSKIDFEHIEYLTSKKNVIFMVSIMFPT